MAIGVIFYAVMEPQAREQMNAAGFVWVFLFGGLLGFFPSRAWRSFDREERANSLELVMLTKLSALGVVFGKWSSVVVQSLLFFVALLPYTVFYYFASHANVVMMSTTLVVLFFISVLLSSFGIVASAYQRGKMSGLSGIIITLLLIFGLGPGLLIGFYSRGSKGVASAFDFEGICVLFVFCLVISLQLMLIAAAKVCPIYENYAAAKRLLALIVLGITGVLLYANFGDRQMVTLLSSLFLVPVCLTGCFEDPHPLLGLRLRDKKIVPWLTYAGWPQGMAWSAVFLLIYIPILSFSEVITTSQPLTVASFLFIGIVLPQALILNFPRIFGRTLLAYTIIQFILMGITWASVASLSVTKLISSPAGIPFCFDPVLNESAVYRGFFGV